MRTSVNLVADIGEGFGDYTIGQDEELLDVLSSANVACGFHGGDPVILDRTVGMCVDKGVAIAAHPGFQDRRNFGRVLIEQPRIATYADTLYQLGALKAFTDRYGTVITQVTPHGRLGNLTQVDPHFAEPFYEAVHAFDPTVRISSSPDSVLGVLAIEGGHELAPTGLPDRGYDADGQPTKRTNPGALVTDPDTIAQRALMMVQEGVVLAVDGETRVPIVAESVLLHGDKPWALPTALKLKALFAEHGIEIKALQPA